MIDSKSDNTPPATSLSSLPGLRGPDYESNGFDDCESYYSLSELSDTNPVRRVPAVEVRRQALAAPAQPKLGCKYPELFRNNEEIPLQIPGPWVEYPLKATGRYISGEPGPARLVVSVYGCGGCDVIYHPTRDRSDFKHANYRPKGYQRVLSDYFTREYPHPMFPSTAMNGCPTPYQFHYFAPQGFEWQCQGMGQAPWLEPSGMSAQSGYGTPFQPLYGETDDPYMVSYMPYPLYEYPADYLHAIENRQD